MTDARRWTPVYLPGLPKPVGPYTPAVRAGDFVYVSGQVPRDFATGALQGDDIASQSRSVLANVRTVLEAAGASMSDVVSVIVYLVETAEWAAFNEVYKEFFTEPYPTRTAVGVELRGIRVEVSCVAYLPR